MCSNAGLDIGDPLSEVINYELCDTTSCVHFYIIGSGIMLV